MATTQNALATGNKVNSALDNPTNFFTAAGLNNRASDIGNLLDSIGNGVQVLQAANTGLTSLQSLVDTAKSIANQVLQAPTGFTTKASDQSGFFRRRSTGRCRNRGRSDQRCTNSLNSKTFVFTPSAGAATTITISSTVAAGNVNSIDGFNAALSADNLGLTASWPSTAPSTLIFSNDKPQTLTTTAAQPPTRFRSAAATRLPRHADRRHCW